MQIRFDSRNAAREFAKGKPNCKVKDNGTQAAHRWACEIHQPRKALLSSLLQKRVIEG